MNLFPEEISGSASSLFGSIQLSIAFLFTVISGLASNATMITVGFMFFACSFSELLMLAFKKFLITNKNNEFR